MLTSFQYVPLLRRTAFQCNKGSLTCGCFDKVILAEGGGAPGAPGARGAKGAPGARGAEGAPGALGAEVGAFGGTGALGGAVGGATGVAEGGVGTLGGAGLALDSGTAVDGEDFDSGGVFPEGSVTGLADVL